MGSEEFGLGQKSATQGIESLQICREARKQ